MQQFILPLISSNISILPTQPGKRRRDVNVFLSELGPMFVPLL